MEERNPNAYELDALYELLEREFEFLKSQDFDQFEGLQKRKQELLDFLITSSSGQDKNLQPTPEVLEDNKAFQAKILECQNLHKRNEILISQKLTAIQEALASLGHGTQIEKSGTYEHLKKKT
ncbi:flagellar protein FlgN [OM182 bacterium]|nr:flagellar protein FlgN [OM182 bacterium]